MCTIHLRASPRILYSVTTAELSLQESRCHHKSWHSMKGYIKSSKRLLSKASKWSLSPRLKTYSSRYAHWFFSLFVGKSSPLRHPLPYQLVHAQASGRRAFEIRPMELTTAWRLLRDGHRSPFMDARAQRGSLERSDRHMQLPGPTQALQQA